MSFKSRDLTVKLSGGGGQCDGCSRTRPDCGGCTPTPDCGECSVSQNKDQDDCTRTRDNYYEQSGPGGAGLALLRQQLQETLGAELR